jgi:hypothetical protein
MADVMKARFNLYSSTHPNLSHCWMAYLELKKRHYDTILAEHCSAVLEQLEQGCDDFEENDIVRLLLYKRTI